MFDKSKRKKQFNSILQRFTAFGALILLISLFSVAVPGFFTTSNFLTLLLQASSYAIIGIGVTFVIITGGIDLSIGSVLALSGVVCALAMKAGIYIPLAILLGLSTGVICGLINAFIIAEWNLPPFIVTLGMMMIARGLSLSITGSSPVSGLPDSFKIIGGNFAGGLGTPVLIMIAFAIIAYFLLNHTQLGRGVFATGSNEEAARLSGINTKRIKYTVYAISGFCAAAAGIILASRLVTAQPTAGQTYELYAVASAVIGGTSLIGGVGTITGTVIGAFIIYTLYNGLNMLGVNDEIKQIVIGVVIIVSVLGDILRSQRRKSATGFFSGKNKKILIGATVMVGLAVVFSAAGVMGKENRAFLEKNNEISVIVKCSNSSFWQQVNIGAKDAEKKLPGIKVSYCGPSSETEINEQVGMVENAINRKVKAIVLAPCDSDALVPVVKKAMEQNIPVVIIDSKLTFKTDALLTTDNEAAGALAAKEMLKRIKGNSGKIAVMSYVPGAGSAMAREKGFINVIKSQSNFDVLGPYYSMADSVKALDQTTDVLSANPDLKGIFALNEPTSIGAGKAIRDRGFTGKVICIGFDAAELMQEFVKESTMQGICVQSPYNMGYMGVQTALKIINGEDFTAEIDTGVNFITTENIETEEMQKALGKFN